MASAAFNLLLQQEYVNDKGKIFGIKTSFYNRVMHKYNSRKKNDAPLRYSHHGLAKKSFLVYKCILKAIFP